MTSTKLEADKSSAKAIGKKSGSLICSLDAPSLLKHKDEIEVLMNENRIDILAVNETKLDKSVLDSYITIENYSEPVRCDRNQHGGGVAVFVKKSVSYSVRTDLPIDDLEIVCIEVKPKCSSPFVIRYATTKINNQLIIDICVNMITGCFPHVVLIRSTFTSK